MSQETPSEDAKAVDSKQASPSKEDSGDKSLEQPHPISNEKKNRHNQEQQNYHQSLQSTTQQQRMSVPQITPALKIALFSQKDRTFVIQLEQDLLSFIQSNTDSYLLKPMNSYYRLLTHQTAEYYSLGHTLDNEGKSILVFKNFGVDLNKPPLLASLPIEIPPMFPLNQVPVGAGIPPYAIPHHFNPNFVNQPQQQQQAGSYGYSVPANLQYQPHPQHFQYQPHQHQPYSLQQPRPYGSRSQHDEVTTDVAVSEVKEAEGKEATPPSVTPKELKLMKREDSNKSDGKVAIGTKPSGSVDSNISELDSKLNGLNIDESSKDSVDIEEERASRESLYQKARERIFQSGEDEEEEDEEEEDDEEYNQHNNQKFKSKSDPYRRIPYQQQQQQLQQLQQPQYPPFQQHNPYGIVPNQLPMIPQQNNPLQQQHLPGGLPLPPTSVSSPQGIPYYQYPMGYNPPPQGTGPFITGGYEQHGHYNNRRNYGYHNNGGNHHGGHYRKNGRGGGYNGNRNYVRNYNNNYNNNHNNDYNNDYNGNGASTGTGNTTSNDVEPAT